MLPLPTGQDPLAAELSSLLDRGLGAEAAERACLLAAGRPDDPAALRLAHSVLTKAGDIADAARVLARLSSLFPSDPGLLADLSSLRQRAGDLEGAEQAADALLALAPQHPIGAALRAEALYLQGRYREAFEFLAPMARAANAHLAILPIFGRLCKEEKKVWQGISPLEQALAASADWPHVALVEANFVLADLYNSARRYDQAWEVLTRANKLKGARFDPDEFDRRVDATIAAWTSEAVAALPRVADGPVPILIVGMPRSGTTLIEQILVSHPRVAAGGEMTDIPRAVIRLNGGHGPEPAMLESPAPLTPDAARAESARYAHALAAVAAAEAGDIARVTDKLPINALNLGLVQAIAPGARILWVRRDPLDTCMSCYFHHFGGANTYAYDLTHLGRFHRSLDRMMLHWRQLLDLDILELPYEEMVADLEAWIRRMLGFCGLEWDDACLRFHQSKHAALTLSNAQVRTPLFTSSIGRWKPYAAHLGALREALGLPPEDASP